MNTPKTKSSEAVRAYYVIRFCHSDSLHRRGECIAAALDEIRIGQTADCEIRLANEGPYVDECFAVIKPGRETGEWLIVPTSDYVRTYVNGSEVSLLHYLSGGDRITFDDGRQELVFQIRRDAKYDVTQPALHLAAPMQRRTIAILTVIPLLLFALLGGYVYHIDQRDAVRQTLLEGVKRDVLQLSVDTVFLMRMTPIDTTIVGTYSYVADKGHTINGSAFVTDDHRIVTARHCIEPWLNDASVDTMTVLADVSSIPARWALEAETYNQLHENDTLYKVVSVCKLYRGTYGTEKYGTPVLSSSFHVDAHRDDIVEKGDFEHVYYWRSVVETYSYKDMMLGDVAWTSTDSVGKIAMPTDKMLAAYLHEKQEIELMGYPEYKTASFEHVGGTIQVAHKPGEMIAHSGKLIHGYSGGPVLVVESNKVYAVGVISRIDPTGGERMYSVPVNEMAKKKQYVDE